MFNPSQAEVRNFFFDIVDKVQKQCPLSLLEKTAYSVILEHPEYLNILENRTKYTEYQWTAEMGQVNPFLHLSMHLTILEQLSIDQPIGICELYQRLCNKFNNKHQAEHELMDCIAEMLWQAQYSNDQPDLQVYFACIKKKLR